MSAAGPGLAIALALVAAGCDAWSILPTRTDPAYCDATTPCAGAARCDPAAHACVAADPGPPCTTSAGCPGAQPVCEAGRCRPCAGAADDATCLARSTMTPRCGAAGACVGCRPDSQASDCPAARPVCSDTAVCRRCARHDECETGVCRDDGSCELAIDVAWVDNGGLTTAACLASGVHDGASRATAYCDIQPAIDAQPRLPSVVIRGRGYDAVRIVGGAVRLVGPGAFDGFLAGEVTVRASQHATPAIYATGDRTVVAIDDLRVGGGLNAPGIDCYSDLAAVRLAVRDSFAQGGGFADGILIEPNCTATLTGAQVGLSSAGLRVRGGTATVSGLSAYDNTTGVVLEDGFLLDNVPGALELDASDVTRNHGGGISCNGTGTCTLTNTLVAGNGNADTGSGGVRLAGTLAALTFDFNTVVRNIASAGSPGGIDCGLDGALAITSSILAFNTTLANSQLGAGCAPTAVVTGSGDARGSARDPKFVDPAGDYHLQAGDPANAGPTGCCIDKAAGSKMGPAYLDHDHDGTMRPRGAGRDIGAYEAQ